MSVGPVPGQPELAERAARIAARPAARPDRTALRARLAVSGLFWFCGMTWGLWCAALPALSGRLRLGEGRVGTALLLTSVGALAVMPVAGRMCDRWTSRRVARAAGLGAMAAAAGPALASSYGVFLVTAAVLGACLGILDVAMNAHGLEVEQRSPRPVMSSFHGLWSLGGVTGGVVVTIAQHAGTSGPTAMAGGVLAAGLLFLSPSGMLLPGRAARHLPRTATHRPHKAVVSRLAPTMFRHSVILLALLAMAAFLSEGAAEDWSALHTSRVLGTGPGTASMAYTTFAAAMTAMRLAGDGLRARINPRRLARLAGGTATGGYSLVAAAALLGGGSVPCAFVGWALVGLGLAPLVPVILGAAASRGATMSSVSVVTTFGSAGLLCGPAAIGALAGASSLRVAILLPGAITLAVAVAGPTALRT